MAAKISAVVTRDAPPASAAPEANVAPGTPPDHASDVVQLERYLVWEDRLPDFKQRDILTDKGKLALARRRYPGADGASALKLLQADFDAERRQELVQYKSLLQVGGAELSPEVKRLIAGTIIPPTDSPPGISGPFRPPK